MITLKNGVQLPDGAVRYTRTVAMDGDAPCTPIKVVQYDNRLPVAAITLIASGTVYKPPDGAAVKVRMRKPDGHGVYNDALGVNDAGIVYITITQQMAASAGTGKMVVEITTEGGIKCSDVIAVQIEENPVQEGEIESSDEWLTLLEIIAQMEQLTEQAAASASAAKASENNAKASENAAKTSKDAAAKSESNAKASETAAAGSKTAAASSAATASTKAEEAAASAINAKNSATAAKASEDAAEDSAAAAKTSETNASASKTAAAGSASAAKTSETNAKASETAAKTSETNAAASKTAAANSANAAKASESNAATSKADAAESASAAKASEDEATKQAGLAKDYAEQAASIAQGQKGFFANPEALRAAFPTGKAGDWAIVGSSDSMWVWDVESSAWVDTHKTTDLSEYYTKTQADGRFATTAQGKKADTALQPTGNASNTTVTFTAATTRANIATGEKLATIMGKLAKWFADLKAVAWSGSYNDLSNKPTALKNPAALTISLNGASQGAYDGSESKSVNVTPEAIGAATATQGGKADTAVQSVNGKKGSALTLSAEDTGAVPVGNRKVLANGIAWKSGSILTPDGWDDYSMIRISTNFGSAFIPKLAVNESSGNILVASALPNNYMNIAGFSIARNSTGGSLSIDVSPYALRLAPSGVTALSTELSVYKIEGFA